MKKNVLLFGLMVGVVCFMAGVNLAQADVTGDFKVVSATYLNPGSAEGGDVAIAGSVNHGAIQSGKLVVVDVTYDYSFEFQIATTTGTVTCVKNKKNGEIQVIGQGACNNPEWASDGAYTLDTTVTTTVILPASGMKAIKAATVTKDGRLNPNGKITGYDWTGLVSIVPLDSIVDPGLIPAGATLVSGSVKITAVSWVAYLIDASGAQIADTVMWGDLFPAP